MESVVISIEALTKQFPTRDGPHTVLDQVDLHVDKGEIFGIIGRSGAGKSTLVRCINLLERPTEGRISVAGRDLTALPERELRRARRDIGMIFQHFNLLSSRTVRGNIALALELGGTRRPIIERRVDELLHVVGLDDKGRHYPAELSGGQKQRVGIARALASNPSVLLCDEATSALDPETTKSILALLRDINRQFGLTVVLITHEMPVVKEIADRVAVLDQGKVVELGRVFDVFTAPAHPVSRALVGETLNREMPESLLLRLTESRLIAEHVVIRVVFTGPAANDPIVSEMVRRFGVSFNILHGHIDYIQGAPYGTLTLEAAGAEPSLQAALDFLRQNNLKVEILGRVAATARAVA
jgi:ABC-type metal ion transport system, ATPase component